MRDSGGEARASAPTTSPGGATSVFSKIESILLSAGLVDELQIKGAHGYQSQWGGRIANAVVERGFADEKVVVEALAAGLHLHSFNLDGIQKDAAALAKVDAVYARDKGVFPIAVENHGKELLLAMADPTDIETLDAVALNARMRIKTVIAGERMIQRAIERHYFGRQTQAPRAFGQIERGEELGADSGEFEMTDYAGNAIGEPPRATPEPPAALGSAASTGVVVPMPHGAASVLDSLLADPPAPAPQPLTAQQLAELQSLKEQYEKAAKVVKCILELCMEKHVFEMAELRQKLSKL